MFISVRTLLTATILAILLPHAAAQSSTPILPFDQVREGMTGTGKTVFQGTEISEFQVEILGTLPNIAPNQNLILGRLSGSPLSKTGVIAGMSGSPVYIDGKLVGAVAYSWGFAKEAIAGITPIEEMLSISRLEDGPAPPARSAELPGAAALTLLDSPQKLAAFFTAGTSALAPGGSAAVPINIPLSVKGISPEGMRRITPDLIRSGLLPVQGGAVSAGDAGPLKLEPGSAVGVKMVRGDVEMTATGTVTWVEGDRVLAFGHPLFGLGDVDLPMTAARVETLLPSLHQSSRITRPLGEVGALRQDRVSGILGRIGAEAGMIPVTVRYSDDAGVEKTFSFEVTEDPLIAPVLVYLSLNGILSSRDRTFGGATLHLKEGSGIQLAGQETILLDNLFAGSTALYYATGTTAYILHLLMNNDWSPPKIAGINLNLDFDGTPRTARIKRVSLDRYSVRPGETIEASVILTPYRGRDITLRSEIVIPPETPAGTLTLHVGGAIDVSHSETDQEQIFPADLDQFIWLINHIRRNDRIFVVASSEDDGAILGGVRLPNLPPSAARILLRPQVRGNFTVHPQKTVLETTIPTTYAVQGLVKVRIRVEGS